MQSGAEIGFLDSAWKAARVLRINSGHLVSHFGNPNGFRYLLNFEMLQKTARSAHALAVVIFSDESHLALSLAEWSPLDPAVLGVDLEPEQSAEQAANWRQLRDRLRETEGPLEVAFRTGGDIPESVIEELDQILQDTTASLEPFRRSWEPSAEESPERPQNQSAGRHNKSHFTWL